jgi:N-acetylmuramoyl-L-alanine amidase
MNRNATWIRRIMCALLVALTLCATCSVPALAVSGSTTLADTGDQYIVTARSLNMRAGAGTEYLVIKHLRKGTKVTYLSTKSGWWRVRLSDGTTGYVDKQYLTSVNATKSGSYTVTAQKLSLRAQPKTSSKRLATIKRNTVLYVSQLNGDWGYVTYNGQGGWVAMKYLKKGGETKAADVKKGNTYTVTCSTLNVRKRANGTRIDTLKQGTTVRVSSVSGDWAYVSYSKNGRVKEGWVSVKYLG